MLYTTLLIESLFSKEQITQLKEIYDSATVEYLNDLFIDPFANNLTGESLLEKVKEFLSGVDIDKKDAKELMNHLEYYFI